MSMMRTMAAGVLAFAATTVAAHAQVASCDVDVSDINFGNVPLQGAVLTEFGTIAVDCTSDVQRVCPNIGDGSGGAVAGTRLLRKDSGSATLEFQLYDENAQVWGSITGSSPSEPPAIELDANGNGPPLQIFARLTPAMAEPGTYSSNFVDTNFVFGGSDLDCGNPAAVSLGAESPSFSVTANLEPSCSFEAQDIDFGNHGMLTEDISAEGGITLTCTPNTAYTVSLGPGNAGPGTEPGDRQMSSGALQIRYGLYKNPGFTDGWGDDAGTMASGNGSGGEQTIPVFGIVPAQPTPGAGIYTDTVVVTVTITE